MPYVACININNSTGLRGILEDLDIGCKMVELASVMNDGCYPPPDLFLVQYAQENQQDMLQLPELKARYPSIPIIVISQYYSEGLALWVWRARASDLVRMPAEKEYLCQRMRALLLRTRQEGVGCEEPREIYFPPLASDPEQVLSSSRMTRLRTAQAIAVIQERYNQRLSVRELASICGLGINSFTRYFKLEHGVSLRHYLKRHRLAMAKELLRESHLNIQEVAFASGFDDVPYFNRVFKAAEGMTPGAYRRTSQ